MSEFPLLPLEKIAKKAGKEFGIDRISLAGVKELRNILLEISDRIAQDAVAACHHAKRVTVKREDILMAVRR